MERQGESDASASAKAVAPLPLHEKFNLTIGGAQGKNAPRLRGSSLAASPLHSVIDEQAWYSTYSATTTMLLVVHLMWFNQVWIRKIPRRRLLGNYNRFIQKKHYHLAIRALLSHPPSRPTSGSNTSSGTGDSRGFTLGPFSHGKPLSGLPLLFYCSHILWSCRALEVVYGSGWSYARVLWVLTWTGLAVDLGFTYTVLSTLRDMNYVTSAPFAMGANFWSSASDRDRPVARRVERALVQRTTGSLTITTCAVLCVFREHFDVPIPVVPLLPAGLPLLGIPIVSYSTVVGILLALSHHVHPVAGVAFGSFSGLLWTSNWTTFLSESYWCNGSIFAYAVVSVLALKANQNPYLPCIDYVSWDSRGEFTDSSISETDQPLRSPSVEMRRQEDLYNTRGSDDEDAGTNYNDLRDETFSLELSPRRIERRISSSSLNYMLDDDEEDEDENYDEAINNDRTPLVPPNRSADNVARTMRSRRVPTGARVQLDL